MIILILWEAAYSLNIWPDFMFPSPITVIKTLFTGIISGIYLIAFISSIKRLLIGYFIAVIMGLVLGIIITSNKTLDETVSPFILSLQSVPSVVWLPLALLWFKMGELSIIFVVVLGGIWNMIINTSTGIKNVNPAFVKAGKNLGYEGISFFTNVLIPASVPYIITGMRLAWAFCWRALMAAEIIGTGKGLGQILMWGRDLGNMSTVLSVMIIIAVTGIVTDNIIFKKIEDKIFLKWGLKTS